MTKECDLTLCEANVEERCTLKNPEVCNAETHDDLVEIDEAEDYEI